MKEAQIAIFCKEIERLQRANDTLTASNQILLDTISIMRADHAVDVARVKAEMAPGFSWPDPDMAQQMSSKLDDAQVEKVKMAQKIAKLTRALNRVTAERDEAIAERDELRGQHANRNTAGKNAYTKRRSRVNKEIKKIEAEIAAELEVDSGYNSIDNEQVQDDMTESAGGPKEDHTGHSHSNRPTRNVYHYKTRCSHCGATGCLRRGKKAAVELCNDFDVDRMRIEVVCHIGYHYTCGACNGQQGPDLPTLRGTAFGPKALGVIVYLAGKKNVDADIAEIFGDIFDFPVAETTIWNARQAAATMLEFTIIQIVAVLKKSKFLGVDETYYSINGESGYVWVVRCDRATLVLAMPTRGATVVTEHMSDLLHIPTTADGYSVYLTHFKILQRCWAHILRRAEEAYIRLPDEDPKRMVYYGLYNQLLEIFRDAKRVAARTAKDDGADMKVCLDFERRVMALVSAYGDHKFAGHLENAAPYMFTFLRYPGMPPTNNDTERDIRDSVVVQRKIRRQFVNSLGMHVFSVIQSFNSTCRKLGLVPWKCMRKISTDPSFNIFQAGPEVKRAPPSQKNTPKHLTYEAYVDGVAVEMSGTEQDRERIAQLAKSLYKKPPEEVIPNQATATQATTAPATAPETADDIPASVTPTPHNVNDKPILKKTTVTDDSTRTQPDNTETFKRTVAPDVHDTLPYHTKPPPTVAA